MARNRPIRIPLIFNERKRERRFIFTRSFIHLFIYTFIIRQATLYAAGGSTGCSRK